MGGLLNDNHDQGRDCLEYASVLNDKRDGTRLFYLREPQAVLQLEGQRPGDGTPRHCPY
jgi:hypothetical protein